MNKTQKIAWCQLILVGIAAIASVILTALWMRKYEYGFLQAWWFGSAHPTILVALTVFVPLFFRKKKGQINFDERDLIIDRQAARLAFGASYGFFIVVCFMTWTAVGFGSQIPAYWLARIALGGWITIKKMHTLIIARSQTGIEPSTPGMKPKIMLKAPNKTQTLTKETNTALF